jgi:hypothetical protein
MGPSFVFITPLTVMAPTTGFAAPRHSSYQAGGLGLAGLGHTDFYDTVIGIPQIHRGPGPNR